MTAALQRQALQARIAEAIGELIADRGARAVGRLVGHDGTTVGRRGSDPTQWPLSEALTLADADDALRTAILARLTGEAAPKVGEAVAAHGACLEAISYSAAMQGDLVAALKDGRITEAERRRITDAILGRRRHEDEILMPALRACGGAR